MKSMGGHDIFLAKSNSGNWSEPENLGYPINSGSEDTHFSLSADGERLYFSAIRPGGEGDRDIYYAELKHSEMDVMVLKGSVKEATTKMPLEASIALSDAKSKEVYGNFNSNIIKGKYTLIMEEGKDYIIKIEAPGHQTYSEEINLVNVHNFKVMEKDFTLVKNP